MEKLYCIDNEMAVWVLDYLNDSVTRLNEKVAEFKKELNLKDEVFFEKITTSKRFKNMVIIYAKSDNIHSYKSLNNAFDFIKN